MLGPQGAPESAASPLAAWQLDSLRRLDPPPPAGEEGGKPRMASDLALPHSLHGLPGVRPLTLTDGETETWGVEVCPRGGFPTDPQVLILSFLPPLPPPPWCFQDKVCRQDAPDFDHLWTLKLGRPWNQQELRAAGVPHGKQVESAVTGWRFHSQSCPLPRPAGN